MGDFNFVNGNSDRIRKQTAEAQANDGDRLNACSWEDATQLGKIKEFKQHLHACETVGAGRDWIGSTPTRTLLTF